MTSCYRLTTKEPKGSSSSSDEQIFVVQKHDASNLHYDVRLSIGGTLKSWAVPKGPSRDPSVKRLAIPTEDHPLDYASFEGTIPEGEYGAGTVIIWDKGTFENASEDDDGNEVPLEDAYETGHLVVDLDGHKLKGGFAFINTGSRWLLIKVDDDHAVKNDSLLEDKPASVVSDKTIEELERDS